MEWEWRYSQQQQQRRRRPWRVFWKENLRNMRLRIQDRFRVVSSSHILSRQIGGGKAVVVYARATGLVGARVFKGNVVFSNALQSIAQHLRSSLNLAPPLLPLSQHHLRPPNTQPPAIPPPEHTDNYTSVFRENSHAVRILQKVALPVIGNICHVFMHGFNQTEVYGAEKLVEAISHRPAGQALITVSNHVASMDDPLVLAALLPPNLLLDANCLRWTLCATDRCFSNRATSAFFRCVKVLPVGRGGGIYQKGIDMAVEKLKRGDWVHIFPEGTRSRDGGKTIQSVKRGVGRLVLDSGKETLVIPFVHSGMQEVMPIGKKFPSIRKRVVVLVGDAIKVDDIVAKYEISGLPDSFFHEAIANRVGEHLRLLKEELDQLVLCNKADQPMLNDSQRLVEVEENASKRNDFFNQRHDSEYSGGMIEELGLRKGPLGALEEQWMADYRFLAGLHMNNLQEGVIMRLKQFKNPAVFVGFAAQGSL